MHNPTFSHCRAITLHLESIPKKGIPTWLLYLYTPYCAIPWSTLFVLWDDVILSIPNNHLKNSVEKAMFKNDFKWNIPAFTLPQWASAELSHTHFQNHRMTSQPWRKQKNSSWHTLLRIQPAGGACLSWRTKQAGTGFWVIVIRERSVRRCSSQWIGSSGRKQRGREGETQGGRGIKKRCLSQAAIRRKTAARWWDASKSPPGPLCMQLKS